jgi:hypothetical protein
MVGMTTSGALLGSDQTAPHSVQRGIGRGIGRGMGMGRGIGAGSGRTGIGLGTMPIGGTADIGGRSHGSAGQAE